MQRRNVETLLGLAIRLRAEAADLFALASELVDEADQLTEMAQQTVKAPPENGLMTVGLASGPIKTH